MLWDEADPLFSARDFAPGEMGPSWDPTVWRKNAAKGKHQARLSLDWNWNGNSFPIGSMYGIFPTLGWFLW